MKEKIKYATIEEVRLIDKEVVPDEISELTSHRINKKTNKMQYTQCTVKLRRNFQKKSAT